MILCLECIDREIHLNDLVNSNVLIGQTVEVVSFDDCNHVIELDQ